MKSIIILFSLLNLQTCSQAKNELNTEHSITKEYRESVIVDKQSDNQDTIIQDIQNTTSESSEVTHAVSDTILNNIQSKITEASNDGFEKGSTKKLDELESLLENSATENINLRNYWVSYINYYKIIIAMQLNDKEMGEKSSNKGIEALERNKEKNSDDYALLALHKGLSFSFKSAMEAPAITKQISKLIETGIKADDKNLRIYYAQGSIDFYTPKEYGGGTKAEEALLKAIELPEKNIGNSKLPTWGKEESYDLIIRFYLREGQKEKAKTYFEEAKKLFPTSYIIQMHQSKFSS